MSQPLLTTPASTQQRSSGTSVSPTPNAKRAHANLFGTFLKYDGAFRQLAKVALTQLVLKILFFRKGNVKPEDILEELRSVVDTSVKLEEVEEILEGLKRANQINYGKKYCSLTQTSRDNIDREHSRQAERQALVVEHWFGRAEADKALVAAWFMEVTVAFFNEHSHDWMREVTSSARSKRKGELESSLTSIIDAVSTRYGMSSKDREWLRVQYFKFLESDRPEDQTVAWVFGTSVFAARVITSNRYADALSIDLFRDSKFILHTNVLLILKLEVNELSVSLNELEKVMVKHNMTPGYFHISQEEYGRALNTVRGKLQTALSKYDREVLDQSNDHFLQSAINLQCRTEEDIDRFISQLSEIPEFFYDELPLTKFDNGDLCDAIVRGEGDAQVGAHIDAVHFRRFKETKREAPKKHDLGLIAGAQYIRSSERCWILTKDGTIQRYAIDHTIRDEYPIAVSLGALINMMAINSGGADIDPTNFAPLFSRMIRAGLVPDQGTFQMEDLSFMIDRNMDINELPSEQVVAIAKEVNRMRFGGSSVEEVDLYLRRTFQGEKAKLQSSVDKFRGDADAERSKAERLTRDKERVIGLFRKRRGDELRHKYDTELTARQVLFVIGILALMGLTYAVLSGLVDTNKWITVVVALATEGVGGFLFSKFFLRPRLLRSYNDYVSGIEAKIDDELVQGLDKLGTEGRTY